MSQVLFWIDHPLRSIVVSLIHIHIQQSFLSQEVNIRLAIMFSFFWNILISPGFTVNKTGSPPRSMKAANTPLKSFIAPKTNFIDVYVTAIPEISVAIAI